MLGFICFFIGGFNCRTGAPFVVNSTQRCQDIFLNNFFKRGLRGSRFLNHEETRMGAKAPTPKAFAIGRCEQTAYSYACSYSWSLLLLIFFIADPLTPGDNATSHTGITDGFSAGASERRPKSV